MALYRGEELLARDVRFRGIRLGVPVDVLLDLRALRALGFEVRCGDATNRFLPLPACEIVSRHLDVHSALVLVDNAFYRERARSLAALRGGRVMRAGVELGVLVDLVFDERGQATAVLVEGRDGRRELPVDDDIVLGAEALRPAV